MSQNKSIGFVCHPYHRGGVTRWMADMAIAYQKQGLDVYFVTVQPQKPFISAGKAETMIQLLKTSGYEGALAAEPVNHVFELSSNAYKADIYKRLIDKAVPKGTPLIIADDYAVWWGACAVATEYPVIAVIHCSVSESYYRQSQIFMDQLSGIVTVSNRCTQKLDLQVSKPLLMQPCGIPVRKPNNSIPMQRFSHLNIPKLRIAWAGRMENAQKRVSDFIGIAALLKQKGIAFVFDIIGDGSAKTTLVTEVKAKGLQEYFVFHGWKPKGFIEETLQAAHIYLLPSNYEGYPVAVMEAFANGCVVVSSRVSGIEDLEMEADTAEVLKVFEIGNIHEACAHIEALQNTDFVPLRQKSKAIAYKYFSIDTCARNYWNFIQHLPHNTVSKNAVVHFNKFKEELMANIRYWKYKIWG